ncbi:hypothetical protein PM10SUCC1_28340 [Propionigenium maris DSM 9537]|uniref:Uncharacterized protein n=1 Tax=Propionigenium maris DSM 9537 TaxID=1123000 RepID=A0A9W6LPT4_9FUSO|nr:hypothetical protein [Propionigenium maris]GLI57320.1 hypothetical protein PM10SUCC1_28340 [Propionigenium maris DSM 9537]
MKETLKLDFKEMKSLVINKVDEEIVVIYIRREDNKHAMQVLVNGVVSKTPIKTILIEYVEYNKLDVNIEKGRTTYQIFDDIYKIRYKK